MGQTVNWRTALNEWLESNPKEIPPDLEELRQQFVTRFPREQLTSMTLEDYALGHDGYRDSFCYWLEWKTENLGSVRGGTSSKWGVWWSTEGWVYNETYFSGAQDALRKLMSGLSALLEVAANDQFGRLDDIGEKQVGRNRNSLRAKPLFLYFPDKFLPISNPTHLANLLRYFGQEPVQGLHARNRQLLEYLQSQPEFNGFHPLQMSRFLYTYDLNEEPVAFQNQSQLKKAVQDFVRFANMPLYESEEYGYKQQILNDLREALKGLVEGEAGPGVQQLLEVVKAHRDAGNNLTGWQQWDILAKYLEHIPADEVQEQLAALLDADGDITERIDSFREAVEASFRRVVGDEKSSPSLNLISLLLMGYSPEEDIIYRASIIDKACDDWGAPRVTSGQRNDGTKYAQYLSLIPPLREVLTKALSRPVDLIDVHSFLWFNYSPEYDPFKNGDADPSVERPFMQRLQRIAGRTRNIILYGPPGTGKTYWVRQFSQRFEDDLVRFVTFHQSYGYEDFVEGWRPAPSEDGVMRYEIRDGVLKQICNQAKADPEHDYLLVIDEINRANIAKVLGELITLIEDDKRLGEENELSSLLTYSGDDFGVPSNLFVLGTMNTADRSIALLDMALRRRFTFVEVAPDPAILSKTVIDGVNVGKVLRRLNERITVLLDRDHQIGHSYFMGLVNLADLRFAWENRVVPLLQEYFYNDGERLQAVIGKAFLSAVKIDQESRDNLTEIIDPDVPQYRMADLTDRDFLDALSRLAGEDVEA